MVAREYADFEPKTNVPAEDFIARLKGRGINLTEQHCRSVEAALKRYERFCYLTKIGEGKQLVPKLRNLENAVRCLKMSIDAVREEEGYVWEELVDKSGAQIEGLGELLEQCEQLNRQIPKRTKAQIKAFFLNRLVTELEKIYVRATGKTATISKGTPTKRDPFTGGRGGRFAHFLRSALTYLPDEFRPTGKTISGLGSRFTRIEIDRKAGKVISPKWIGLPYSPLAKPDWKENQFRRLTGKRP